MRKNALILLMIFAVFASSAAAQQATVTEEGRVFKTYPFSGPDPSPIMTRSSMWGRGLRLYPYFSFDNLSHAGTDQSWNVVRLENPFIQALIMPAEGGKLIGAIEKSTGKEFLYLNQTRKFRHIALRGPWTSGGVEANFGIVGHTPATATPVDYLIRKNPDGSVTCIVGNMDLPSRTEWRVAYTIRPDKAYIEAKSLWFNPQPLNQSYYVWMNAANHLGKDLEFILPGNRYIGHDYSVPTKPWPVVKDGRNLAFYREHSDVDDGSFFIVGSLQEFSGGYWHDSGFGYGHWAIHEEVPGQKFFRWSLARDGAIWENLLTDSSGPYFEPQNGRLLDQNDHEFFAPFSTDQWSEIYFPYKKIGPMVKATPYGALNVRREGGSLVVSFCALQKIDETLRVSAQGRELFAGRVALEPMEVYEKKIEATAAPGSLRVEVGDKLSYVDDPNAEVLKRPLNFHNFEENTTEGIYQAAERQEKERNYDTALEKYLTVLKREPLHMRALTRVAELYYRRAEYKTALDYAHKALDYVMYDPDANWIYGITARRMDNLVDAKETLGWAARSMKYRATAYSELGAIYTMEGNLGRAVDYLKRSLEYDANNVRSHQLLATAQRIAGQRAEARKTIDRILEIDPLNHLARFEAYLLDPGDSTLRDFQSMIRNELPHETYLEIATYYTNLRQETDALKALEAAPDQAVVRYTQAWLLRKQSPEKSRQMLEKAASLSPYLVFPFREESVPVFVWASATRPDDWKAKYYLGLTYWGLRRSEEALRQFADLGNRPDYAPVYISRAYLERQSSPDKALADYERAHAVDPKDWRNWFHLAGYYNDRGMNDKALKIASGAAEKFPEQDVVKVMLARTLLGNGRYAQCHGVLGSATILPFEGQRDVRELFSQCQVCLAMESMKKSQWKEALTRLEASREYPERLGTGKPNSPDYRIQDFLSMLCYRNLGDSAKAAEALGRVKSYRNYTPAALEKAEQGVNEWSKTLPQQNELKALQDLSKIVRGGGGRRRGQ